MNIDYPSFLIGVHVTILIHCFIYITCVSISSKKHRKCLREIAEDHKKRMNEIENNYKKRV